VLKLVLEDNGSAQKLDFLSDLEKDVLKTAFEVDQEEVLRVYSTRQPFICQGQSLNLHFDANESEEYIAMVHQKAFENENIHSLYYLRSRAGIAASKGACSACES